MCEGGPRFEGNRNTAPETSQQKFRRELRSEVNRVLERSDDPLSVEVGNKILEKLAIKDRVDDLQQFRDDPGVYQKWKLLGVFIVIDRTSKIEWEDVSSGFNVNIGDQILDIHLPPVPEDKRDLTTITDSLALIAEYIVRQDLHPKYIMGVTFEKLARVSRRQGFKVIEPELPEDIKQGVERVYRRFGDAGINKESMGRILMCYQDTNAFLRRFGT